MLVFLIVGPKCTLAASQAAICFLLVMVNMTTGQTDGRTPDRYITLYAIRGQRNKESLTEIYGMVVQLDYI